MPRQPLTRKSHSAFTLQMIFALTSCLSALSIIGIFGFDSAHAGTRCIPGVGCFSTRRGFESTLSTFNIYINNRTGRLIRACVAYHRFRRSEATVDGSGTGSSTSGCWDIGPGQKVFVIDNAISRYATFSATALDGSGLVWPERQVDMGGRFTRFEYTFN